MSMPYGMCLAGTIAVGMAGCGRGMTLTDDASVVERPPNIVIIFTDDQGYGDVGVFGAEGFDTPHLDQMAHEGVRFTDFYTAQPVCSASRTALLTGCYPNRIGITGALGPNARHGIHDDETTLGELCQSVGYATAAYGKWHLGHRQQFLPVHHGFDDYCGIPYSNDMWPLHPSMAGFPETVRKRKAGYPDLPLIEGDVACNPVVEPADQEKFTGLFTRRAVEFIHEHKSEPFFVYLAHPMPHVPLYTSEAFNGVSEQGRYGDVISEIDWSVGQVLKALEECGVDDNTLVIFTTDNGPWLSYGNHGGSTGPLREGKGTTWDGGVRVPFIARWPGVIPADVVRSEPMMTIDLFPTIANLIGAELPERSIDGKDATNLLLCKTGAKSPQEAYFFYYHGNDLEAMRCGKWKLHFPHTYRSMDGQPMGGDGLPGKYDYTRKTGFELYNLATDIGEQNDVALKHPDVVERLSAMADAMRADLGDNLTDVKPTGKREPGRIPDEPKPAEDTK